MTARSEDVQGAGSRNKLDRNRVVEAAMHLADREGLGAVTMRRVGQELGVEAMSLYRHVANKSDLLDGLVDAVFREIPRPEVDKPWREQMRRRTHAAWETLRRHSWALALVESRQAPGPETLAAHDAVLGCLRAGGFSIALAGHAFAALDSYLYGFVLQHQTLPFETKEELEAIAGAILESMPEDEYPHLREFTEQHVLREGYDFRDEFEFGLELVLDGLERKLGS